jgi:Asp-tRNA(Asn)/Glu-tRNA(Gln) amidotransferase A subunit family amidase
MTYDIKPIHAPTAAGFKLKLLVGLVENGATGAMLSGTLLSSAGITAMRQVAVEEEPYDPTSLRAPQAVGHAAAYAAPDLAPLAPLAAQRLPEGFRPATVADYVSAYQERRTTPEAVAERFLAALADTRSRTPALAIFVSVDEAQVRADAKASTERWAAGAPLGPLDGVPVGVKDEVDLAGHPTTVGTRFLGTKPAAADATVVARLRAAGALLLGKTNMHEIGIGVTGINPHHGAARNPYAPDHATGGSSSGSAAAVASGLCPLAVAADGGGSIRIPAAFCGVVGLKATFGRVSEVGAAPLCWSVAHVGPIGATVADVALGYALMAGRDAQDDHTALQPPLDLSAVARTDLTGVRLGVFTPWFDDATPDLVKACRSALKVLTDAGATVKEVAIPELALLRTVHLVTIVSEMAGAHLLHYAKHRKDYGHETRMNLALAHRLGAADYVHAQRLRTRVCRHFARALGEVDAILTPTTGMTAPVIPANALGTGTSDIGQATTIMRYAQAANLTGYPAISFPVGYDAQGLPIGLQAMSRPWEETLLLRLARVAEVALPRRSPAVHYPLLG